MNDVTGISGSKFMWQQLKNWRPQCGKQFDNEIH